MAYRAGVSVANMEFVQFHPTCLFHPKAKSFLISEAVRGEGGILRNAAGKAFNEGRAHRSNRSRRGDIVARAIDAEIKRTGAECVYLDITHKSREFLQDRFPSPPSTRSASSSASTWPSNRSPSCPARIINAAASSPTPEGRTELPGLWAVGEVGCTGLHGANRLASNSLLEALVVAHRAADAVKREKAPPMQKDISPWESGFAQDPRRAGRDLSQLARDPATHVGLRRHRADDEASAPRREPAALAQRGSAGLLLELQDDPAT